MTNKKIYYKLILLQRVTSIPSSLEISYTIDSYLIIYLKVNTSIIVSYTTQLPYETYLVDLSIVTTTLNIIKKYIFIYI